MKYLISLLFLALLTLQSCQEKEKMGSVDSVNWTRRTVEYAADSTLVHGATYLSVYSHIYSETEHRTHSRTATVSIRNMNRSDTVFIDKAEYFNTKGELLRTYFKKPIFIVPMETVEIIIDADDEEGGSGANFLFEWTTEQHANAPYFECVMISTSGQQGLSFSTKGQRIN